MEKRKYPIGPQHYTLYEEIGQGVSASVHRALCIPFNEIVAIKILDFERDNCDLNNISREAQTMILVDHPNVLKSHCSFVSDHNLWVVMPYMAAGSCLHILKAAYPGGFEEVVIATILREVLKGLEYLHHHGHIYRDVKAGNILIDARGAIKLGDFGVSACLFDSGDRQRMRNTFVGTPCWMAPEVMEQLHGYDFKADIWSFGITALELAHGHAPFSKYPPMKVLLMTLQNAPPGLDYERDRKFSKSFKQMIASCLVKDPSKRPSAKKLLKHSFFKQGRSNDYIARRLLEGLPSLGDGIEALKRKEEDMLAQKKMPDGQMEELSQNEYKRGISGWNFNLEDVKAEASLIQDEDNLSEGNHGGSSNSSSALDVQDKQSELQATSTGNSSQVADMDCNDLILNQPAASAAFVPAINIAKDKCDRSDDDSSIASPLNEQFVIAHCHGEDIEINQGKKLTLETRGESLEYTVALHQRTVGSSDSISSPEINIPLTKGESDKQSQPQGIPGCNGATSPRGGEEIVPELPSKISKSSVNNDDFDEKAKPPVIQQRGRFKVTSENLGPEKIGPSPVLQKSHSMQVLTQHPVVSLQLPPADAGSSTLSLHSLFPTLQTVLQTNILQREAILTLMKQISAADFTANHPIEGGCLLPNTFGEKSLLEAAHDREKELLHEITDLQGRLRCAQDEIQKNKTENSLV